MTFHAVEIDYVNWRGERRLRSILPLRLEFGTDPYHATPGWFVVAMDLENRNTRNFRLAQIFAWRELPPGDPA